MAYGKVKADSIESSTKVLSVDDLATAATAVPPTREVAAGTGLTGGGDLSANRTISADVASQAEAEGGTSASKLMTPQRTAQAIAALSPPPVFASQAEAEAGTSNTKLMTPLRTAEAIAELSPAPTLLYNRRPALHRGSLFYKTAAAAISIVAGAVLNGHLYEAATAVTMPGSFTNNTDYAIWQHPTTAALVADASFTTAPAGATGGSIVGGFHYIPSGRPTAFDDGSPTGAAEILEFSLWDLTWRPSCPDPRGMACIEGGFWGDLYLVGATSYAGTTFSAVPSSRIGLTIADGSSPPLVPAQYGGNGSTAYANGKWYVFTEVARSFGKRLLTYDEFSAGAYGAPEASSRGSDPGTVQWERVSKFGWAQATGTLWQWGQETCTAAAASGWTSGTETEGRGQVYGPETRAVVLGGNWNDTALSGSRCALWNGPPWISSSNFGARFAAGHLVLG
jgi:hypothetical protein